MTEQQEPVGAAPTKKPFPVRLVTIAGLLVVFVVFAFLVPIRDNPRVVGFKQTLWDIVVGNSGSSVVTDSAQLALLMREREEQEHRNYPFKHREGKTLYIAMSGAGTYFGKWHLDQKCESLEKERVEVSGGNPGEIHTWVVVKGVPVPFYYSTYTPEDRKRLNLNPNPPPDTGVCPECMSK